jgi:hypothetical protein
MSFSTESVHSGGYVLIRYEGMIGDDDFDQGHAAVKTVLKGHGWTRVLMRPKSSNPNSYRKSYFGAELFINRLIVRFSYRLLNCIGSAPMTNLPAFKDVFQEG